MRDWLSWWIEAKCASSNVFAPRRRPRPEDERPIVDRHERLANLSLPVHAPSPTFHRDIACEFRDTFQTGGTDRTRPG
jgi:hypothetical protein